MISFGIRTVLLMVLSGPFFATLRVNFHTELLSLYACYQLWVKVHGLLNVCKWNLLIFYGVDLVSIFLCFICITYRTIFMRLLVQRLGFGHALLTFIWIM